MVNSSRIIENARLFDLPSSLGGDGDCSLVTSIVGVTTPKDVVEVPLET